MTSASSTPTPPVTGQAPPGSLPDEEPPALHVVLTVAGTSWAVPVEQVRGVLRAPPMVPIPGSPPVVRGLAAVRGGVATVLDLGIAMGGPCAEVPGSVVLVGCGDRLVGLAVDAVLAVRAADVGNTGSAQAPTPMDAVALCTRYLLTTEDS